MKPARTTAAATRRQQAEERLQNRTPSSALPLPTDETERLVHELQVHQIELEMQTEELREARAQMEAAVARYVDLYDFAPVGYLTLADSCEIVQANLTAATLLGVNRAALAGQSLLSFILPEDEHIYLRHRQQLMDGGEAHVCELRLLSAGGVPFWARLEATLMPEGAGGQQICRVVISDISEHKWLEEAQTFLLCCGLPETGEDFFASLARYLSISLGMEYVCIDRLEGAGLTAQTLAVYNNGSFETNVRYALKDTPCGEVADKSVCCYPRGVQQQFPQDAALQELKAESYYGVTLLNSKGKPIGLIAIIGHHLLEDPKRPELLLKLVAPRAAGELERRLAEEEHEKLQYQLNQAQKMESVGRLAGGVAHDFNNKLSVIIGYVELALMGTDADNPLCDKLKEIRKAAGSSADLTRQLLAFARKQTVSPKVLDLNDIVSGMFAMLRRLLGEEITLVWQPGNRLWPVNIDPSQIDQLLVNLCINARDAIGGIGTISISTQAATLDAGYCASHPGSTPGDYVSLMVGDSGCGMDAETLANIFEPFFTTKAVGQGTGLGLASVYGVVKQNNGFINVSSEPGSGATFAIYLPRHLGKKGEPHQETTAPPVTRGNETILLVEDETAILTVTAMLLKSMGYSVLSAATPGEAMRLAREHSGEIHLLMTDVIMPEMNGRDLARKLLSLYPDLKRLFMSGYTADIIAERGVIDAGVNFIQKPFSMPVLAEKVRQALA